MNYKTFAAGAVTGVALTYGYAFYKTYQKFGDLQEMLKELNDETEFDQYPPDEMIGAEDPAAPEDFFGEIMEQFEGGSGPGMMEMGEPDGNPFEEDDEKPQLDFLENFWQGSSIEELEEEAEQIVEDRVMASLQTGPKQWGELKEDVYGHGTQLGGFFEQAQNQSLDEAITRLRDSGKVQQREEDNKYELSQ